MSPTARHFPGASPGTSARTATDPDRVDRLIWGGLAVLVLLGLVLAAFVWWRLLSATPAGPAAAPDMPPASAATPGR